MTQAFAVYYRPRFKDVAIFVTDGCIYLSRFDGLMETFGRIKRQRGEFRIKFPSVYRGNLPGFVAVGHSLISDIRDVYSTFNRR